MLPTLPGRPIFRGIRSGHRWMGLMPLPESWRASFTAWGFLLPALCLISVSVLVPAVMALVMSFSATGLDVREPLRFVGLANLRRLLTDPMVRQVLLTTFLYLIGVVPPIVFGALSLAVLVNRSLPGIHWLRGALYTPVLVSIVVAAIAFRWLYAENGLINGWLATWFGDVFTPIGFLTTPQLALPAVMLVTLWKGLGYYMVIFLAGLQGIPKELYEAAELDGSEGWLQHLDITFPLLKPYVTLVAVMSSIAATKVFEEVFLMTQGGPADSTRTIVYYVYDQAFAELEISYACTLGLALFLVVMAFTLIRMFFTGDRQLI